MEYLLEFTDTAKKDIEWHKKTGNKFILNKLLVLFDELIEHPFTGTGKPELLKYDLVGHWPRINREHRLVYKVTASIVFVVSAKGHYE